MGCSQGGIYRPDESYSPRSDLWCRFFGNLYATSSHMAVTLVFVLVALPAMAADWAIDVVPESS